MDFPQNYDTKRWGCSLFILSVLVWLITITAVFQIRINDLAGNIGIALISFIVFYYLCVQYNSHHSIIRITENVSGYDDGLKTVSGDVKTLKHGVGMVGKDVNTLKDGFGKVDNDVKTLNDSLGKLGEDVKTLLNGFGQLGGDVKTLKDVLDNLKMLLKGKL